MSYFWYHLGSISVSLDPLFGFLVPFGSHFGDPWLHFGIALLLRGGVGTLLGGPRSTFRPLLVPFGLHVGRFGLPFWILFGFLIEKVIFKKT